ARLRVGPTCRRGDDAQVIGRSVPRTELQELVQEGRQDERGTIRLPLLEGRASRVGAYDRAAGARGERGPRPDEQQPRQLRRRERARRAAAARPAAEATRHRAVGGAAEGAEAGAPPARGVALRPLSLARPGRQRGLVPGDTRAPAPLPAPLPYPGRHLVQRQLDDAALGRRPVDRLGHLHVLQSLGEVWADRATFADRADEVRLGGPPPPLLVRDLDRVQLLALPRPADVA